MIGCADDVLFVATSFVEKREWWNKTQRKWIVSAETTHTVNVTEVLDTKVCARTSPYGTMLLATMPRLTQHARLAAAIHPRHHRLPGSAHALPAPALLLLVRWR